ncbi:nuclear transport factor 2 family protein [Fontisubflavum oceani]|uniref:YybH family protein n=1 Tax=Fontisubflavum oceani TaxID=2978973 RepID=UPI0025B2FC8D|nr:nuclear transport factor 2 family protein [Fontisubflavum oceani]WJY21779.1 nuclear transport factor 2 family protein [Fontisubflavum oceani]
MRVIALLSAVALSTGIAIAEETTQTAIEALTALNDRFNAAAAAHDADGLLDLYADDTLWIAQGTPVTQGLQGPRDLFEFVTSNQGEVTHTIDHLFVSEDAPLAVMIGSVDARIETAGLDATGTYLFVLEPTETGWEVVTDMWHQHDQN